MAAVSDDADALAERLMRIDRLLDRTIDDLVEVFTDDLVSVFRRAGRAINSRVTSLDASSGALKPTSANMRRVFAAETTLRQALDRAGADDIIEAAMTRYTRVIQLSARASSATPKAVSLVDAFIASKRSELQAALDTLSSQLAGVIRQGIVGAQNLDEVLLEAQELFDGAVATAKSWYDTSLSQVAQVTATSGDVLLPTTAFLYSGPVDLRIRTWCLQRVGRVFTKAQIDQMNNGQLPNTYITRGGYNCRHHWRPVSGTPLEALAGTNKPVKALAGMAKTIAGALQQLPTQKRIIKV